MAENRKSQIQGRPDLSAPDQDEENSHLYGMGRGLFGNEQGDEDIEKSLGSPLKDTPGLMTDMPSSDGSALPDIERKIKTRPRAANAPGAIVPYMRRDEALLDIIAQYGESLYEADIEVLDFCAELLRDVQDEERFNAIRAHFESIGIKNMPTWENRKKVEETYAGALGIGGATRLGTQYPWDRPGGLNPATQKRADKGYTFYVPKPPSLARRRAGRDNAKKIGGTSGGMHSRMARARKVLDTVKNRSREAAGKKNGDRMRGSKGPDFRRSGMSNNPMMKLAAGKYDDLSHGKVSLTEGNPTVGGMPWFHAKTSRNVVGGVPCIVVAEEHIICSGSLPRPKFTEGYKVWDCEVPLATYEMELAFSALTEGMTSVRPWYKEDAETKVIGIPTEGVIMRASKSGQVEFLTFDSESGYRSLQEYMIASYEEKGAKVLDEAVMYSYVRAGAADLILDRVMRKLNRLNILDVFEDAVFDTASEALYVLLNPQLVESEVQEVAQGLQQEYPEVQILGGPLDEDVDWWVLYLPKQGMDFGPELDRIFEPKISCPVDVGAPDVVGRAIQNVAAQI